MSTSTDSTETERPLPEPALERWQPLRSGLMNLYLYENEELRYEGGRLLLRGNNGTGKSRVLALQLPFLLDGEVHPARVEPDGEAAKRMEWHLLMNGRHTERTGYTWLELGRRDADGTACYRTIGIGLEATKGRQLDRWFFVTDQRVGLELDLMPARTPLSRRRLEEAIGERGRVFTRAKEYRRKLDETFFGLGEQRYRALVDLLIQLRKPQLSRQLDENRLSRALSEALPPLGEEVLGEVAEAFRELETDAHELAAYAMGLRAASRDDRPRDRGP